MWINHKSYALLLSLLRNNTLQAKNSNESRKKNKNDVLLIRVIRLNVSASLGYVIDFKWYWLSKMYI